MLKKIILFLILFLLIIFFFLAWATLAQPKVERGVLSVYFMEEKVGYEEYVWEKMKEGYQLSVLGRLTKPTTMEIEKLTLKLDSNFIARNFYFKGSISGIEQEVVSTLSGGEVENLLKVSGQERKTKVKIRRDAFLLPNPIFSTYLVLTKKFGCSLQQQLELSAYIIPQLETAFTLEPQEDNPCQLIMKMGGMKVLIETDDQGNLKSLSVPSQKLRVVNTPEM
ncbi:MAG: hypothetical protein ACE5GI_00240 [Candidatus Aminicenantales bacterium]